MGTTSPDSSPVVPRIISVRFRLADGRDRRRMVRCPYYAKDPEASLYGLQSRLADMALSGAIIGASISIPASPRHLKTCERARALRIPGHRCGCFPRWTEIPELAVAA